MSDAVPLLRAVIDWSWPIAAILGALTAAAGLIAMRTAPPFDTKTPVRIAFLSLAALLTTTIALATGSCVVGSAIAGRGICSFKPRGSQVPLDPLDDFLLMQGIYLLISVMCFAIAAGVVFHLLPGRRTGWERLLFVLSFGRRGTWR